jgi:hypothetical protein
MNKVKAKKPSPIFRTKTVAVRFTPEDYARFKQYADNRRWPVSTAAWLIIRDFLQNPKDDL